MDWKDPLVEAFKDSKYPEVDPDSHETPYVRLPERFFPKPYRKGDEERYPGKYVRIPEPEPDLLAVVMGKGAPYMLKPKKEKTHWPSASGAAEKPWPPLKIYHHILFLLNED